MRRTAEWLLLPFFLLPVGIAVGFHLWAGDSYRSELEAFKVAGRARAGVWLAEGGPAHHLVALFGRDRPGANAITRRYSVRFQVGRHEGRVWGGAWKTPIPKGLRTWQQASSFPGGLSAAALADAPTRLAIETGRTSVASAETDEATKAFASLLNSPEIRRLAKAPLPAATKRYLVQRWIDQGVTLPYLADANAALEIMQRAEEILLERDGPFARGAHTERGLAIMANPPRPPAFSRPIGGQQAGDRSSAWYEVTEGEDGPVALRYFGGVVPVSQNDTLWQDRLEAPLAGSWMFVRRYGPDWWDAPRYQRWIAPLGAMLLACFLIPTALWISLRRRRRLDEARSRFINELAHDLRTPLTSLRLYSEMLSRETSGDADRDRYASVMSRESTRVSALLGNLLDLSRLDDGGRQMDVRDVDVGDVARATARDFTILYPDRADDLEISGPEGLVVRADTAALTRCLANLLDNAGKYTADGDAVRIRWQRIAGEVRITVSDEGPGIPMEERRVVFTRYARGARAVRDGLPGTGLGLALVKELMTDQQGSVRFVSSEVGVAVELRLPVSGSPTPGRRT